MLPAASDVVAAANAIENAGYLTERDGAEATARDPWGTPLRLIPATRGRV